jgi:hypothetical protein
VVTVAIDSLSGMRATPSCPPKSVSDQVFVAGTEPVGFCPLHGGKGAATTVSGWDVSSSETVPAALGYVPGPASRRSSATGADSTARNGGAPATATPTQKNPTSTQEPKKKGLLDHLKDIFH